MFFTGVIGAFYAHYIGILTPDATEFGVPRTVEVLAIAYVGGRGHALGLNLGSVSAYRLSGIFPGARAWRLVMYGALLIGVIIYAPKGLSSIKKYIW